MTVPVYFKVIVVSCYLCARVLIVSQYCVLKQIVVHMHSDQRDTLTVMMCFCVTNIVVLITMK